MKASGVRTKPRSRRRGLDRISFKAFNDAAGGDDAARAPLWLATATITLAAPWPVLKPLTFHVLGITSERVEKSWRMLIIFGVTATAAMLFCYSFEHRSFWYTLAFAWHALWDQATAFSKAHGASEPSRRFGLQ
jgi:hypothetical protein